METIKMETKNVVSGELTKEGLIQPEAVNMEQNEDEVARMSLDKQYSWNSCASSLNTQKINCWHGHEA